ncbi:hypothetical protein AB0K41_41890 [Actinomadura coerulea]
MGGTPVRCGASRTTVHRSGLGEIAGYGRDKSHHAFSWGAKLMLVTTAEGAVCAFSLAHPKEQDERRSRSAQGRRRPGPRPDPPPSAKTSPTRQRIGRPRVIGPAELAALRRLVGEGVSVTEAARTLKIGRSTA